jgi:hypothetical protein
VEEENGMCLRLSYNGYNETFGTTLKTWGQRHEPIHNSPNGQTWKAGELRKMPPHQRDVILATAAEQAEMDYRKDPELTAFEAFGEQDLYGDSIQSCRHRWATLVEGPAKSTPRLAR